MCSYRVASIPSKLFEVCCAFGHYLHSVRKLSKECQYIGIDSTKKYIDSAKAIFKNDPNSQFVLGDIFDLNVTADIGFCCNVLFSPAYYRKTIEGSLIS